MGRLPLLSLLVAVAVAVASVDCAGRSCDEMCEEAALRTSECLDEWGYDWSDLPWDGESDYKGWCDTWVFEQQRLKDLSPTHCEEQITFLRDSTCADIGSPESALGQ